MSTEARFSNIPLAQLIPNTYNARRFEENMTPQRRARFEELVASITGKGILEPLLVRPVGDDKYEVIAGERRYRASLQVTESTGIDAADYNVPCMVRDVGDDDAFDLMIIENMQRDDLTPFETAEAFAAYLKHHGNTTDAAATLSMRTGIPVHAIRRQVRLLEVPAAVTEAWRQGTITMSHVELFTRVGDEAQIIELLAACQRNKLSVRDLAERIGTLAPDLERGFFDKTECQVCPYNTSVQSGLFTDVTPGGKCSNPACFEAKQGDFLSANWEKSKPAEAFGTRGFRFGHRSGPVELRPLIARDTAERCLGCDQFVSILRLTGAVVSGYDRTCVGPRACYAELYEKPAAPAKPAEEKPEVNEEPPQLPAESPAPAEEKPQTQEPVKPAPAPTAKSTPAKQTKVEEKVSPVFSTFRGERQREELFKQLLPDKIREMVPQSPQTQAVILLALALSNTSAKIDIIKLLGLPDNIKTDDLAAKIFAIDDIEDIVQQAAVIHLMLHCTPASVRRIVAEKHNIDVARDWRLTEEYLKSLTKAEIVAIGEEQGVNIWKDEKAEAYRQKHFKGKALMALKNEDLIKIILESGVDLTGRVPAEVLGRKQG